MSAVALTKPPPPPVAGMELTEPPVAGTGSGAQAGMVSAALAESTVGGSVFAAAADEFASSVGSGAFTFDRAACAATIRFIAGVDSIIPLWSIL